MTAGESPRGSLPWQRLSVGFAKRLEEPALLLRCERTDLHVVTPARFLRGAGRRRAYRVKDEAIRGFAGRCGFCLLMGVVVVGKISCKINQRTTDITGTNPVVLRSAWVVRWGMELALPPVISDCLGPRDGLNIAEPLWRHAVSRETTFFDCTDENVWSFTL